MSSTPTAAQGTAAIRAGITLLGTIGFALSYDALRQMAVAIHIRGLLTYAFPLVIDGFIAIGVGTLLILRTAPLRSRVYVWALVGAATVTSIWANALHAVRLNQQTRLYLDNLTVGALSAIAPLALAGAVHLYIVIRRHLPHGQGADATYRHITIGHSHNGTGSGQPRTAAEDDAGLPEPTEATPDVADGPAGVALDATNVPEAPRPHAKPDGEEPNDIFDELLALARTAPLGRGGRASRRNIETAIRAEGHPIGKDRLTQIKDQLQAELDDPAPRQTALDKAPAGAL
ncbi:DUF2637 domain-containing protein [Streptomyces noursei]|uniref:DUF2637 domain-containing protein n=1 Tax=Streptomyces noursei TaxID=1971 RepID=UPI0030F1873A